LLEAEFDFVPLLRRSCCVMSRTGWTPSIVPKGDDQSVYLVEDDLGRLGRVWREADVEATDRETVIVDLLEGQYKNPSRVVAFSTALLKSILVCMSSTAYRIIQTRLLADRAKRFGS
jgi:hypothetical protein